MIVKCCANCPFFHSSFLSLLIDAEGGHCGYDAKLDALARSPFGLPPGPDRDAAITSSERRLRVKNRTELPDNCPLIKQPIILTVGD